MRVIVFWLAAGLLIYTYVGYPLVVFLWAKMRPRRTRESASEPLVSLLIVAYNESATIGAKIRDCLAIDYPRERLQIVVASDGSTDDTALVAESFVSQGVEVVAFDRRRGKPAVLNHVVPRLEGEIVVLADARQRLDAEVLRPLLRSFADPEVGAVSGELVLSSAAHRGVGGGVDFYWRYEKLIRCSESAVDSTIGATGALYAIRRTLFEPIPEDTILDDVLIPLRIARQGYRVLFDRRARVFDRAPGTNQQEFRRKVRTLAGNFQLFSRERWLLNPASNRLWLQTVSHKGLRLLLPLLHVAVLTANVSLLAQSRVYVWAFGGQVLFYTAAFVGYSTSGRPHRSRLVSAPHALCLMSWATVVGCVRFMRGTQSAAWEPTRLVDLSDDQRAGLPAEPPAAGHRVTVSDRLPVGDVTRRTDEVLPTQASAVLTRDTVAPLAIASDADVVNARRRVRALATAASFAPAEVVVVVAAISELARNIVLYAKRGEIAIQLVENGARCGIRIEASDEGPGIVDLERVMRLGYSTSGSLGLPAVRRVMDEFDLQSDPSSGTRVVVTKWHSLSEPV